MQQLNNHRNKKVSECIFSCCKTWLTGFCLVFMMVPTLSTAKDADFAWVKSIGADGVDIAMDMAIDDSGYVYTTGSFSGTVDFDPGPGVVTLTAGGTVENIYITKTDAEGNLIWAKGLVGPLVSIGYSIAVDNSGYLYVTGQFRGTVDFDAGVGTTNLVALGSNNNNEAFVTKYDVNGNFVWAKRMGGNGGDIGRGIDVDGLGNVYVTGAHSGGGPADFGSFTLTTQAIQSIFVTKLDATGNFIWAKGMGSKRNTAVGQGITVDDDGNAYVTGYIIDTTHFGSFTLYNGSNNNWNAFVTKLDNAGNVLWAKNLSKEPQGQGYPEAYGEGAAITLDNFGHIYVSGIFRRTVDFNPGTAPADTFYMTAKNIQRGNTFIVKLDTQANFIWAKGFTGEAVTYPWAITTDAMGDVYSSGDITAFVGGGLTADFDPGPNVSELTVDTYRLEIIPGFFAPQASVSAYISKLDSSGNFVWVKGLGGKRAYTSGRGITVNKSGAVYTTGGHGLDTVDFDPGTDIYNLRAAGGFDIFIHKLSCAADTSLIPLQMETDCNGYSINGETYTEAGSYITTLTNQYGCDSIITLNLTIKLPEPVINIEVDTLSTTQPYKSYQWLKNGAIIPGATNDKYTVTENADYRVIVTDENGCTDTSDIYKVTNHGVGVDGLNDLARQIQVYPNPADDIVHIVSPLSVNVSLTGIDGRRVINEQDVTIIHIKNLSSGIYFLRIIDKEGKVVKMEKIVKK